MVAPPAARPQDTAALIPALCHLPYPVRPAQDWSSSPRRRICRARYVPRTLQGWKWAQCLDMMNFTELPPVPSDYLVPVTDQLRLAVAAYLARFKGSSRDHTESDLRCYLAWCAERSQDPLTVRT